jgi:predicted HTH transcriptional regulator
MIQLGQFESLGSGINKVTHYHPFYAPGAPAPSFVEGEMFTTIIPLALSGAESRAESRAESGAESLLRALLTTPLTAAEWSRKTGRVTVTGAFKRSMRDLLTESLVERTIPEKPQSRLQKYRLTDKGRAVLASTK